MSQKRRRPNMLYEDNELKEPPNKRRKTRPYANSYDDHRDDCSMDTLDTFEYQQNDEENCNHNNHHDDHTQSTHKTCDEYACFHFSIFRQSAPPHPCLYKSCANTHFASWSDWKRHWVHCHRDHYMNNNQTIGLNEFNRDDAKIKQSSFNHLNFLCVLGSTDGQCYMHNAVLSFDLSLSHFKCNEEKFRLSQWREHGSLIWDPLRYQSQRSNHCKSRNFDRIRSGYSAAKNVPYFNQSRILFRCGGYYSSEQEVEDDLNYNQYDSVSALCDAFDIGRKQHFKLPDLPLALHSSSTIYISELQCLLNIGGDDNNADALSQVDCLLMDESIGNDRCLAWNANPKNMRFPNMAVKRSYRPSIGLYRDQESLLLYVCGGCNNDRYDGLKSMESLDLTPWLNSNADANENEEEKEEKQANDEERRPMRSTRGRVRGNKTKSKSEWTKQRNMNIPRRDASNLLQWRAKNCLVVAGGDHGETEPTDNSWKTWHTSEIYELSKAKWVKLPNFPAETSHAQHPFIWIEGGINDDNYWSGLRETRLFDNYASFDASYGVLCVIGNGFAAQELGIVSFYDPRTKQWQSGGDNQENWLFLENSFIGTLPETQELRNICAV